MKNTIILFTFVLSFCITTASAADCRVTKTADTNDGFCTAGDCSLREAVADTSCTMIDFSLDIAGQTVGLTQGEIVINRTLSIAGYGAEALTISGNNLSRIFFIASGTATISGVTLTGGNGAGTAPNDGGAIRALGGINLDRVVLTQNSVCPSCRGAALSLGNPAPASVVRSSTIYNNPVDASAVPAVATETGGPLVFYSSTIAFNPGPAIFAIVGQVKVIQSTVASNGSGVVLAGLGTLTAADSVIIDVCRCHNLSQFSSEGYNIARSTPDSMPMNYQASDVQNTDPMLGPLQYNGGHTPTMAPFAGSAAIDGGSNGFASFYSLTADQRGYSRIFDGNGNGKAIIDVGALEFNAPAPSPVTVAGRVLGAVSGNPLRSQTVKITDMLGNTRSALSSSLGWFVFEGLPPGFVYKVSVAARRGAVEKTIFAGQNLSDADILVPGQ